ncbi:hypothetical protein DES53_108252 [Roseimicrobium gellanilyticum]|uniref:Helix-turn-helix protein n=1 Tax=Roseimicrobium gellanilyticum TaxID=748857 RepID=A0A366HFF2_9BACT|nr:AraC family transcriptional regulator [Roseimicrobium gellanilyticum]RBP40545.1 hypothetical protein DES53_108252 [Roseimicrobium gellanilyticum]
MALSEFEVEIATRVADIIQRRPSLSRDVAALARLVGVTPYHLAQYFHRTFGMSLHRYAQELGTGPRGEIRDWVLLAI